MYAIGYALGLFIIVVLLAILLFVVFVGVTRAAHWIIGQWRFAKLRYAATLAMKRREAMQREFKHVAEIIAVMEQAPLPPARPSWLDSWAKGEREGLSDAGPPQERQTVLSETPEEPPWPYYADYRARFGGRPLVSVPRARFGRCKNCYRVPGRKLISGEREEFVDFCSAICAVNFAANAEADLVYICEVCSTPYSDTRYDDESVHVCSVACRIATGL